MTQSVGFRFPYDQSDQWDGFNDARGSSTFQEIRMSISAGKSYRTPLTLAWKARPLPRT